MSRVTKLDRFPKRYLDIAATFEGDETAGIKPVDEHRIKCTSKREAASLRLDLYSFRRALENEGFADDYPRFKGVRMYVQARGGKVTLLLQHADAK